MGESKEDTYVGTLKEMLISLATHNFQTKHHEDGTEIMLGVEERVDETVAAIIKLTTPKEDN